MRFVRSNNLNLLENRSRKISVSEVKSIISVSKIPRKASLRRYLAILVTEIELLFELRWVINKISLKYNASSFYLLVIMLFLILTLSETYVT